MIYMIFSVNRLFYPAELFWLYLVVNIQNKER
jgi:hypothetical protein